MNRGLQKPPGADSMSYILEALRRADAERQQGQLPGLHSPFDQAPLRPEPAGRRGPIVAVGLLTVTLAAGLGAWWWASPGRPAESTARAVAAAPALPSRLPASAPTAPAQERSPALPPLPVVVSAAPAPAPVLAAAVEPAAAPPPASTPTPTTALPDTRAGQKSTLPLSPPASARAQPLTELPEAQRSQLPPLKVGGSVWSDSAPSRFVILDGQVLREGDLIVPGLVLERIDRRSVTLRWRERRLEIGL